VVRHGIQQGAPIARPRRIAIVTSSFPAHRADFAGAFIPGFASALVDRGCQVSILTPDKAGPKETLGDFAVHWFPWAGGSKALVNFRLASPSDLRLIVSLLRAGERALARLIDDEKIEACMALWAVPSGYLAWRACGRRVPYSVWALGSDIHTWARRPGVGSLVRTVLKGASHRFADGIELGHEVTRISGKDCTFLPTTRRLPSPAPLPQPLGSGVNFLFVGRLEAVKGADVIVDAMIRLVASGADARLTMCGPGAMEPVLRAKVEAAALTERVRFLGSQPGDVIAGYMSACDCLVIPSRMESIPIVFSEALQAGIPLLVTDVGDMGQLAREHGLADPVPAADPAALASAMEGFGRDRERHVSEFRKAREKLLAIFDVGATADRYLETVASA
jgi:glycosyltransferase involved in cell wall biosynthesis